MGNAKIQNYYVQLARNIKEATQTRNKSPDFSKFDIAYVKQFIQKRMVILELGAGSGLLLNGIMDDCAKVTAVEMYPEFSRFIRNADHVTVVNCDILSYTAEETFDVILLFGVMNFFDSEEAIRIYGMCAAALNNNGMLLVKNQMGIHGDVVVDGLSQELGQHYFSHYRTPDHEAELIRQSGLDIFKIDDLYPDEFNRWPNTRFKVIVAEKAGSSKRACRTKPHG